MKEQNDIRWLGKIFRNPDPRTKVDYQEKMTVEPCNKCSYNPIYYYSPILFDQACIYCPKNPYKEKEEYERV